MKKKLFSILTVLFSLFFTSVNSIEYKNSSKHWSLVKNGPLSVEEAVQMFFKDRPVDVYEGVWMESKWGMVAIVRDGKNKYKKYVIDVGYSDLNGTHETTYFKTANKDHLTFYTRITWKNGSSYKFATATGDLFFLGINTLEREIYQYAANPYGTLTRVWPADWKKYNSKFVTTKTQQEQNKETNYKDYWWVVVILALGTFFIYTLTVKKPKLNILKKKKTKQRGRIAKYWAGEDSLAFSFWGVSTLGLTMLQIPNWIILAQGDEIFDTMSDIGTLFYLVYLILFFVAVVIAYVGCWRSAAKYISTKIKKKKSAFWGYSAYVLIAISTVRVFASIITEI